MKTLATILLIACLWSCGGLSPDFGSPKHEKIIQLKEVRAQIVSITRMSRGEKDFLFVVFFCNDQVFRSLQKELEYQGKVGDITILTPDR
jgi:hypothetical protein